MSSKYWSKKVDTTTNKDSWEEPFSKETTVSPKSIQALDILLNFSGSWAAAHSDRYSANKNQANEVSNNPEWRVSQLGQWGLPEINFVPYNHRTNAFADKGGSLIGHPISFSVVGPTAKGIYDPSGSAGRVIYWNVSGNTLNYQDSDGYSLTDTYGDLDKLVSEGLYLVVNESGGSRKAIPSTTITINGLVGTGQEGLYPKEEYGESAKFEIFRVESVRGNIVTLQSNKLLSDYFEIPAKPAIASVMFFQPYVTRLAAVPESGAKGAEKVFMVVSPERAAFNDQHSPAHYQTEAGMARYAKAEQGGVRLPIPIPTKNLTGKLESTDDNASKADGAGIFRLYGLPTGHGLGSSDIINITKVDTQKLEDVNLPFKTKELFGYFNVVEAGVDYIILRREIEVDPQTGLSTFGENLFLDKISLSTPTANVFVEFSVHEPVSQLFNGEYNADKVEACRLTNLIDPAWVDRTTKQVSSDTDGTLFGGSPARADRSVFTTNIDPVGSTVSNPGSLLDLGFRMVLFPAKENAGGYAVPDFDRPITSLETLINNTSQYANEKQTITVDYSAGTVTLSHPPTRGSSITPVGVVGEATNNPRGEVVLFAACVPFSMEQGQTGVGVSITGGDLARADHGEEDITFRSVLGQEIYINVLGVNSGTYVCLTDHMLPKTGILSVIQKENQTPLYGQSHSAIVNSSRIIETTEIHKDQVFGYRKSRLINVQQGRNGFMYQYQLSEMFGTNLSLFVVGSHDFVFRKQNPNFVSLINDNFYGSAWRSDNIRFAYADLTANTDGSITVMPTATAGPAKELRSLFPLGGALDRGRVAFDINSQRWKVGSPPHKSGMPYQIGLEVVQGKAYISDSNVLKDVAAPRKIYSRVNSATVSHEGVCRLDFDTNTNHSADISRLQDAGGTPKVLVEGMSIISKSKGDWTGNTYGTHRMVIAFKDYNGTDEYSEAPNNPINWVGVPIATGMNVSAIALAINTTFEASYKIKPCSVYTENSVDYRLILTERNIEIMPQQPFLLSQDVSGGITVSDDTVVLLTLRSADPEYPERFVTVPLRYASITTSDPLELAAHLNRPMYDRNLPNYVGGLMNNAGFLRQPESGNPYLQATGISYPSVVALDPLDVGERQVLWAGHDDPRHPANDPTTGSGDPAHPDYNKVILLCGNLGYARVNRAGAVVTVVNDIKEYSPDSNSQFFNVLVELGDDRQATAQSLLSVLRGEFLLTPTEYSKKVVRCGLFRGTHAHQKLQQIALTNLNQYNTAPEFIYAKANEGWTDDIWGTIGAGYYLGSAEIYGPIAESHIETIPMKVSQYQDSIRSRVYTSQIGTGNNPNLGLWNWHKKNFVRPDLSIADNSGFYALWVSYTNQNYDEFMFPTPFTYDDGSSLDGPALAENERKAHYPPFFCATYWVFGVDSIYEKDTVSLKGDQFFLRLFTNVHAARGIVTTHDVGSRIIEGVLLQEHDLVDYPSYSRLLSINFDPHLNYNEDNLAHTATCDVDIYPSVSASLNRYRSIFKVRNSPNSEISNLPSPSRGVDNAAINLGNVAYISGGHVDLFTTRPTITPAGFSMGTFVGNTFTQGFLSHIEQGVFQTGGFGEQDSEAYFANLNKGSGNNIGATIGTGRGTSSDISSVKAGVAGVRFSGDTQIWLENVREISSGGLATAAFVLETNPLFSSPTFAGVLNILNRGLSSSKEHLVAGQKDNDFFQHFDVFGGHAPFGSYASQGENNANFQQTTVLLGLTKKDYAAWRRFSLEGESLNSMVFTTGTHYQHDNAEFSMVDNISDMFLCKNLKGMWIYFALPSGENPPLTHTANTGAYRITETPVLFMGSPAGIPSLKSAFQSLGEPYNSDDNGLLLSSFQNQPDFVACVAIRVGRYAQPNDANSWKVGGVNKNNGYTWQIYADPYLRQRLMMADVTETGGDPTGIRRTVTGLTINPLKMGRQSLHFQIIEDGYAAIPNRTFQPSSLYGVFPTFDHKGSPKSVAYFSINDADFGYVRGKATQEYLFRGIVRSWNSQTLMEDMSERGFRGAFAVDEDGKVQIEQSYRLGLGVVIDGGLGTIHATSFRANPRPIRRETIGSLTMFGSSAYPNANINGKTAPIHLSSTFDTSEFLDDLLLVGPKSSLIFEDARGGAGLGSRLKENVIARLNYGKISKDAVVFEYDNRKDTFTNDALFPYNSGGIVFKGTGGVSYQRPYSALSANTVDTIDTFLGKERNKGLRGLGMSMTGSYFLLPKGPTQMVKKRGDANFSSGTWGASGGGTEWVPPDSVPLYEFINTMQGLGTATFGVGGLLPAADWEPALTTPAGHIFGHLGTGGSVYQGYRKAISRTSLGPLTNPTDIQVRLLEGMVVENTTNGTFYSLGETGRNWIESQYYTNLEGNGATGVAGVDTRPAVQGSRIVSTKNNPDESGLFYDFNPLVGFKNSNFIDPAFGGGDRIDVFRDSDPSGSWAFPPAITGTDRIHVRDSHIGHDLRVTANVEFVPITGRFDCDGGLYPPYSKIKNPNGTPTATPQINGILLDDADAILASNSYSFKPAGALYGAGDVGKFLYICGTHAYNYTGWWIITDVITDYEIELLGSKNVAVLRKWQRPNDIEGENGTNIGALPLQVRSPLLKTISSVPTQGWFDKTDCSDMYLSGTNRLGSAMWDMQVPRADINTNGTSVQALATWLNVNAAYNGTAQWAQLQAINPTIFASAPVPFIKWRVQGPSDSLGRFSILTVSYDLSVLGDLQKDILCRGRATIFGAWQSKGFASYTNPMDAELTKTFSSAEPLNKFGFFSRRGVNSSLDRGIGDRNSYQMMAHQNTTLGVNFYDRSTASGIRWVFSHPLVEEQMGSYLHLTRPVRTRFDSDTAGFVSPTTDGATGAPFWTSRFQTRADILAGDFMQKTDIFRINRCPSTYSTVIGGDCEIYYREPLDLPASTPNNYMNNSMIYSPLSVDFPCLWGDSTVRELPREIRYFDLSDATGGTTYTVNPILKANTYSLQPIAREKIVSINPTSMSSNILWEDNPTMVIGRVEQVMVGGSPSIYVMRVLLKNPDHTKFYYYPPTDNISVGTTVMFRGLDDLGVTNVMSYSNKVGYVIEIEPVVAPNSGGATAPAQGVTILKIVTPNFTLNGDADLTNGYLTLSEDTKRPYQANGIDLSRPWKCLSFSDLVAPYPTKTQNFTASNYYSRADYHRTWAPAQKWWEIRQPLVESGYVYDRFNGEPLDNTQKNRPEHPHTLSIDLTEAFTQAQQSGSGISSPLIEKTPRGVRLNRIWVNFGLWGNPMTNPNNDIDTWEKEATPAYISDFLSDGSRFQAVTFNLVVTVPSLGQDLNTHRNSSGSSTKNVALSGQGTTPFNGRNPTHTEVSVRKSNNTVQATDGSWSIPLYINREAGDLSPNTSEKFATFGVVMNDTYAGAADWTSGSAFWGMGNSTVGYNHSAYELSNGFAQDFVGNATNPIIWGGIDTRAFVSADKTSGNIENIFVQSRLSPRSSIFGQSIHGKQSVNLGSAFGEDFNSFNIDTGAQQMPRSLHPQGITGITIAHASSIPATPYPNAYLKKNQDPQGMGMNLFQSQETGSCPHAFTVALTPINPNILTGVGGGFVDPSTNLGKYGNIIHAEGEPLLEKNEVGNWLRDIENSRVGFINSMLPVGAKITLEVTIPHTSREYVSGTPPQSSNGCWIGQVLCSFEVETADGTALSLSVSKYGDE